MATHAKRKRRLVVTLDIETTRSLVELRWAGFWRELIRQAKTPALDDVISAKAVVKWDVHDRITM